jgi:hypothetical protein
VQHPLSLLISYRQTALIREAELHRLALDAREAAEADRVAHGVAPAALTGGPRRMLARAAARISAGAATAARRLDPSIDERLSARPRRAVSR